MSHDDKTLPLGLPDPNAEGVEDPQFWLETTELAALASITRIAANAALKRCYTGGTWRKAALVVRVVDSVGGNRGKAYQVFVPSLPVELSGKWKDQHPALFKSPEVPKAHQYIPASKLVAESNPTRHAAIEKGVFLEALIKPALMQPKHTTGRGEMIRKIVDSKSRTRLFGQNFR